ncbi:hypothetical protein EGI15_08760 [Chryseobacterium cucumeris]|uniref:MYM-type domain-containing protein n=1 Tax=Chryseobacterium cucumeris TaxID=1813611 RepID=A0ABX9X7I8_9FLAO|nr:hypothetical protein EGI15_08760 [Chryseobacterium cucumeris]
MTDQNYQVQYKKYQGSFCSNTCKDSFCLYSRNHIYLRCCCRYP